MAFSNELIPPENHALLREIAIARGAHKIELWKWTVDRERKLFLFRTHSWGGPYEGTNEQQHLVLGIGDHLVTFIAESENVTASPRDGVLRWCVSKIVIPQHLESSMQDIHVVISEALKAQGWLFRNSDAYSVQVCFA